MMSTYNSSSDGKSENEKKEDECKLLLELKAIFKNIYNAFDISISLVNRIL
jgi:hypothetical protein